MSELTLQREFLASTNENLRTFLRRRNVPCNGKETHAELAERCFWARKLGLPVKSSDAEATELIAESRSAKLILDGGLVQLPRPETLSGWETSPSNLPNVARSQIELYLISVGRKLGCSGAKTLGLGKGLLLSNHVKEVELHGISPNINYCFIRAKVTPQTKSNKLPYHPWVILNKTNGAVLTAECSCIVGVQSGCKHIAAVLFAVVETTEKGLNRACTSQKVTWGLPSSNMNNSGKPVLAENIHILKITNNAVNQKLSKRTYRSNSDPRAVRNRNFKSIESFNLDQLADVTNGNCGVLTYADRPPDYNRQEPCIQEVVLREEVETTRLPLTVTEAVQLSSNTNYSCDHVMSNLTIDNNQRDQIIVDTNEQSDSKLWHEHRVGRVTSSNAKLCCDSVHDTSPYSLSSRSHTALANVMSYYGSPIAPSLEWGKTMEKVSIKHYIANHKLVRNHTSIFCERTGLWLSTTHPYIAASPDGVINCQQCGRGLVEVKNPYKYRKVPITQLCTESDSCLMFSDGVIHLNKNHGYYYQIQFQLWVTGFDWCDFVVRTTAEKDNLHVERIRRDHLFVAKVLPKLQYFFIGGVVPEIVNRKVQSKVINNAVKRTVDNMLQCLGEAAPTVHVAYPCSECNCECIQNPHSNALQSIACDQCDRWSHFACIGLTGSESFLKKRKALWKCNKCRGRKKMCLR